MIRLIRTAGILLGLFVFFIAPIQAQTTVFINEIHYDNTGTDEGEEIEIAGPAGTDLTGWEIILYNGSNGTVYDTDALAGTIPDDGSGFGFVTVAYPSNGIQNGSPDGIVLSDGVNVIQFLSYEGELTATDGIANGMTSTDIGVSETSSTPIGNSLQLMGTGSMYEDFTWAAEIASNFGSVNDSQTFEGAGPVVFINEIHYDNTGTDEGEEIEIAGTAGTDLTGWEIILYNGSNGTVYDTDEIGGTIPDDGSGFGFVTVAYPSNGIQNGSPDGIVLSDGANVIQFLSYEGEVTATDGIANGMTSTDIGVSEGSSTPVGFSLQLVGTGLQASDFTWAAEMASTFGAVNTGQVFAMNTNDTPVVTITAPTDGASFEDGELIDFAGTATDTEDGDLSGSIEWTSSLDGSLGTGSTIMSTLSVGTHMITASATDSDLATGTDEISVTVTSVGGTQTAVFINEIHYDNSGTDEGEEIEIAGPAGTDLTGWEIVLYNGSNGTVYDTDALSGTIPDDGTGFGFVTISYPSNGIQNGSPDGIVLSDGVNVIQFLSYEGVLTAVGGIADGMTSTDIGVSETSSTPIGNSLQLSGTGTFYEDFTWESDAANTFGAVNTNQEFVGGSVMAFINEIHYDNVGGDEGEAIEIAGPAGADLDGWSLVLYNGSNGTAYNTTDLSGVLADDGSGFGFLSFAISGIQNGAPDGIVLYDGENVVEFLSYEGEFTAVGGVADGMMSTDIGVSETSSTPVGNSLQLVGTGTKAADFTWAVDMANTFGAVNTGQVFSDDPVIEVAEIYEIQGSGLASPFADMVVRTENNVVTAVGPQGFFMQTPADRTDGDVETSDGIYVFTDSAPSVAVGDLVDVEGSVVEFFDLTEFTDGPVVTVVGTGVVPEVIVFDETLPSPDQPQDENAYERFEGMIVTIPNGLVSGPSQSFGSDPEAEAYIVASGVMPFRETGIEFPGLSGLPIWDGNPEVFEIDPDKLGLDNVLFTTGSTFSATGALAFEFGEYEVWATELTVNNLVELPIPVRAPESNEGTIGSLNLLRFGDGESEEVIDGRADKFSMYIRTVLQSPDILAVQEVEDIETLSTLAARLNEDDPSLSYEAYLVEGNDFGGIDVGYLVNTNYVIVNGVTQLAADETLSFDGSLLHDRPPLLLEADIDKPGFPAESVQVLAVHNRSLSGIDDEERVRIKRLEQAQSIATIVQDIQTTDPNVKLAVIGDFNAFEFTDGYVDVIGQISGDVVPEDNLLSGDDLVDPNLIVQTFNVPAEDRYSFVFNGTLQVLDHVLTSSAFEASVTEVAYGRGNAGAPEIFEDDYTTLLYSSDHDGLVMYVMLEESVPATAVLAAENSIYLDRASAVLSGDVLVANDASGDVLGGSNELVLDRRATIAAGFQAKADGITVFPDAVIGSDVFYNSLDNFGTINGTETSSLDLPVFNAPEFPAITPGTDDITIPRNTAATLDAGAYGEITVRKNSVLTLTGGEYHIKDLTLLGEAQLRFDAETDLRIAERFTADLGMLIGPADGTSLSASDLIIYVGGMNGENGGLLEEPLAVSFGNFAEIDANIYAPNGSIVVKGNSTLEGSFVAKDIQIGRNTAVTLDSYWATFAPVAAIAQADTDEQAKETISAEIPEEFALGQNYPNPFNPTTTIPFSLPEASHVKLVVYDMLGRLVDTIVEGELSAGYHNASFDASRYPSGTYIYRIEASNFTSVQKMVLVK